MQRVDMRSHCSCISAYAPYKPHCWMALQHRGGTAGRRCGCLALAAGSHTYGRFALSACVVGEKSVPQAQQRFEAWHRSCEWTTTRGNGAKVPHTPCARLSSSVFLMAAASTSTMVTLISSDKDSFQVPEEVAQCAPAPARALRRCLRRAVAAERHAGAHLAHPVEPPSGSLERSERTCRAAPRACRHVPSLTRRAFGPSRAQHERDDQEHAGGCVLLGAASVAHGWSCQLTPAGRQTPAWTRLCRCPTSPPRSCPR